ncbi:hypothetical protein [Stratiformator vulcanicus]|uniref:Uncharacterized protein n=1 Tax=Stratiformator vulcanicus TaxID=2527980 RepID=A0A517R690_9PLAN|nr:hypothetical protein [Stratiformator vulcanicus]QDT39389.1 hypothetical protein Pan189_37960 [Stratiformator vulcanicus]
MPSYLIVLLAAVAAAMGVLLAIVVTAHPRRMRRQRVALKQFRLNRERLEAIFLREANRRGKPRGVRWVRCNWGDEIVFAEERTSSLLTAFVQLSVGFEAIEGGEMEDVEAVSLIRDTTGLFHYEGRTWGTGGRALFNMGPDEAVERLGDQYERIEPLDVG